MISYFRRTSKKVVFGILCSAAIVVIVGIYISSQVDSNGIEDEIIAQNRTKRGTLGSADVLSIDDKKFMLQLHNDNRRRVSPSASDMKEMVWDEGLAEMAVKWSRRCEYVHSTNPGGENLALDRYNRDIRFTINNAIESWDVEKDYYEFQTNGCNAVCGHYTQEIWATTHKVGCGTSSCDNIAVGFGQGTWPKAKMTVCSYMEGGNYIGLWPYRQGSPCSECPDGWGCNDGLCQSPTESSDFGNGQAPIKISGNGGVVSWKGNSSKGHHYRLSKIVVTTTALVTLLVQILCTFF